MSNARIKKTLEWGSALVYGDEFYVNRYTAKVYIVTVSDDSDQQNIAYERMKLWTHRVLDSSVLIAHDDPALKVWQATGARVIVLPEEPVDQIIGIMLYLKLNSIMENRMVVSDIEISSTVGDDTGYLHNHNEGVGQAMGESGWWVDPRPSWYLEKSRNSRGKVVNLDRIPEWSDYGLEWEDSIDKKDTVVFANFNKDADQ
jgi:hypothetical protein